LLSLSSHPNNVFKFYIESSSMGIKNDWLVYLGCCVQTNPNWKHINKRTHRF
jgi:hypothetical protein